MACNTKIYTEFVNSLFDSGDEVVGRTLDTLAGIEALGKHVSATERAIANEAIASLNSYIKYKISGVPFDKINFAKRNLEYASTYGFSRGGVDVYDEIQALKKLGKDDLRRLGIKQADISNLEEGIHRMSVMQYEYAIETKNTIFKFYDNKKEFENFVSKRTTNGKLKTAEDAFQKDIEKRLNAWKSKNKGAKKTAIEAKRKSIITSVLNDLYGDKIYSKYMFQVIDKGSLSSFTNLYIYKYLTSGTANLKTAIGLINKIKNTPDLFDKVKAESNIEARFRSTKDNVEREKLLLSYLKSIQKKKGKSMSAALQQDDVVEKILVMSSYPKLYKSMDTMTPKQIMMNYGVVSTAKTIKEGAREIIRLSVTGKANIPQGFENVSLEDAYAILGIGDDFFARAMGFKLSKAFKEFGGKMEDDIGKVILPTLDSIDVGARTGRVNIARRLDREIDGLVDLLIKQAKTKPDYNTKLLALVTNGKSAEISGKKVILVDDYPIPTQPLDKAYDIAYSSNRFQLGVHVDEQVSVSDLNRLEELKKDPNNIFVMTTGRNLKMYNGNNIHSIYFGHNKVDILSSRVISPKSGNRLRHTPLGLELNTYSETEMSNVLRGVGLDKIKTLDISIDDNLDTIKKYIREYSEQSTAMTTDAIDEFLSHYNKGEEGGLLSSVSVLANTLNGHTKVIDVSEALDKISTVMKGPDFKDNLLTILSRFYDTSTIGDISAIGAEDIFGLVYGDREGIYSIASKLGLNKSDAIPDAFSKDSFVESFLLTDFVRKQRITQFTQGTEEWFTFLYENSEKLAPIQDRLKIFIEQSNTVANKNRDIVGLYGYDYAKAEEAGVDIVSLQEDINSLKKEFQGITRMITDLAGGKDTQRKIYSFVRDWNNSNKVFDLSVITKAREVPSAVSDDVAYGVILHYAISKFGDEANNLKKAGFVPTNFKKRDVLSDLASKVDNNNAYLAGKMKETAGFSVQVESKQHEIDVLVGMGSNKNKVAGLKQDYDKFTKEFDSLEKKKVVLTARGKKLDNSIEDLRREVENVRDGLDDRKVGSKKRTQQENKLVRLEKNITDKDNKLADIIDTLKDMDDEFVSINNKLDDITTEYDSLVPSDMRGSKMVTGVGFERKIKKKVSVLKSEIKKIKKQGGNIGAIPNIDTMYNVKYDTEREMILGLAPRNNIVNDEMKERVILTLVNSTDRQKVDTRVASTLVKQKYDDMYNAIRVYKAEASKLVKKGAGREHLAKLYSDFRDKLDNIKDSIIKEHGGVFPQDKSTKRRDKYFGVNFNKFNGTTRTSRKEITGITERAITDIGVINPIYNKETLDEFNSLIGKYKKTINDHKSVFVKQLKKVFETGGNIKVGQNGYAFTTGPSVYQKIDNMLNNGYTSFLDQKTGIIVRVDIDSGIMGLLKNNVGIPEADEIWKMLSNKDLTKLPLPTKAKIFANLMMVNYGKRIYGAVTGSINDLVKMTDFTGPVREFFSSYQPVRVIVPGIEQEVFVPKVIKDIFVDNIGHDVLDHELIYTRVSNLLSQNGRISKGQIEKIIKETDIRKFYDNNKEYEAMVDELVHMYYSYNTYMPKLGEVMGVSVKKEASKKLQGTMNSILEYAENTKIISPKVKMYAGDDITINGYRFDRLEDAFRRGLEKDSITLSSDVFLSSRGGAKKIIARPQKLVDDAMKSAGVDIDLPYKKFCNV